MRITVQVVQKVSFFLMRVVPRSIKTGKHCGK